ncbi:MAG: recombinase family protein [Candidatus Izemoplasmatales bacterium]
MPKVTVIPSTINPITQLPHNATTLRKVAAYARVSTNKDEQYTSYEAQVNFYEKYIKERPNWEYTKVYADEGISGTSTKRRTDFNRMIKEALLGKIDLIITKSISRFARNTLDTISYVRKLKTKGVEVFFEKENLWTLDPKSELILTIMASIAQEESRSISQNVIWGKRVSFQQGKVSFAYSRFLGYKKVDDKLVIDEDQAVIVRMIYRMFLVEGKTPSGIAKHLKSQNIKTPAGKSSNWSKNTIISILTNEKYKGDALLQKSYTANYLEHVRVENQGQIPQYYVENNHQAIIDKDIWKQVQFEMERRVMVGTQYSSSNIFASRLKCGDCGGYYGRKKWHSNTRHERFIYQCNQKYKKGTKICKTPHLSEEEIKQKFIDAYNITVEDKDRIIADTKEVILLLTNTEELDKRIIELENELLVQSKRIKKLLKDNSKIITNSETYNMKYKKLSERFNGIKDELDNLKTERNKQENKYLKMNAFLTNFKKAPSHLSDWNELIWRLLIEKATVHRDGDITFVFINGSKLKN